jgi:hypothetical protein
MAEVDDSDVVTASMSNGGGGGEATPTDKTAQAPAANPLSRKLQRVLGGTGGGTVGPLDPEVSESTECVRGGVSAVVCVVHASTRLQAPIFFSSPGAALIFFMLMTASVCCDVMRSGVWSCITSSSHTTHTHTSFNWKECEREWVLVNCAQSKHLRSLALPRSASHVTPVNRTACSITVRGHITGCSDCILTLVLGGLLLF